MNKTILGLVFLGLTAVSSTSFANTDNNQFTGKIHFVGSIVVEPCGMYQLENKLQASCYNESSGKMHDSEIDIEKLAKSGKEMKTDKFNMSTWEVSKNARIVRVDFH